MFHHYVQPRNDRGEVGTWNRYELNLDTLFLNASHYAGSTCSDSAESGVSGIAFSISECYINVFY